jgi:phage terminase small subunit
MTERQKALLENLPKCNNNVNKAAKLAGYSEMTANKAIYTMLGKNRIKGIKSEEAVREKYLRETRKLKKKFLMAGDSTNASRMHEVEGKTLAIFRDNVATSTQSTIVIDRQGLTSVPVIDKVIDKVEITPTPPLEEVK